MIVKGPNRGGRPAVGVDVVWINYSRAVRRVTNLADRMYRLPSKRRPRAGARERPAGPRLVRGRGLARRRKRARLGPVLVYLGIAAGLTIILFKYLVAPFVAG